MKTWAFLQLAALAAVCLAQQDCNRGACYPQVGDLLIGREQQLSASSTCGILATEIYCTPFGQMKMKCCPCDSQNPAGPNAHTIQNVLSSAGTNRWWQSRRDVNPVTIQVDLQQLFQVNNVMLVFKGPRPDALVIERTKDFGRTWQPALYMATNCASTFPRVSTATPNNLDHTYCYTLPPTTNNPYRDQPIYFHPLHQYSNINYPPEYKIQEVSGFTGLRVNLTRLGEVPRLPGRSPSRFYALKEMRVTGSCFCYGHANRCLPDPTSNYLPTVQVNGLCECQHNTAGVNCERCADFYNDLPWRAAQQNNPHICKRCECNNHSQRCHFDAKLYELSGRRSGGVCDGCLHNTAGPQCERCAPNHYRNPNSDIRRPDACLPCHCNSAGSVSGGQCNPATGVCLCKANVEGPRCDRCKAGYYGLSASNTFGCSKCSCSASGSLSSVCDAVTGQCVCRPNMQGVSCDRCAAGFWSSPNGCQPCNCDPNHSISSTCDQKTGQCVCRPGSMGRTCGGCPENTYGNPLTGCRPCRCDSIGSAPGGCDKRTGACPCKPGVVGARCDSCARGYCASFPQCPVCPSCFFSLDLQLQNLTLDLDRLAARLDTQPGSGTGPVFPGNTADRIRKMEDTLQQIRSFLSLPLPSEPLLTGDLDTLRTLQLTVTRLNNRLYSADPTPDLQGELDKLQALLFNIQFAIDTKRNATTYTGDNYAGALALISIARERSVAAEKQANDTGKTIKNSATTREDVQKNLDSIQPGNTNSLQKLGDNLATRPNLTPTAVQVCGSTRLTPCTPQECKGELCPADGAPPCGQNEQCTGALPQAVRAVKNTDDVKTKLQQLNNNITQAYAQIQETQNSADRVRLSAEELANRIKVTQDDLDYDLKDIKDFIKKLKDFLSDPSSDPAEVQRVCEAVLGVRLPEGADSLRKKLQEMQDLAANLPDSTKVLKEAEPKLEQARRLLQDAERTRNDSVLLQNGADQLLSDLNKSEDDLEKLQKNLEESQNIVNKVKDDIQKVDQALTPLDQLLTDVGLLMEPMRPLLEGLKGDVQRAREQTGEAEKQAGGAGLEADLAATELAELQEQLKKLKQNANASTEANEVQQRLQDLQQNGTALIQETMDMMQKITDKERSLQAAKDELQRSSDRLAGLDAQLHELINEIQSKATKLNMCQG